MGLPAAVDAGLLPPTSHVRGTLHPLPIAGLPAGSVEVLLELRDAVRILEPDELETATLAVVDAAAPPADARARRDLAAAAAASAGGTGGARTAARLRDDTAAAGDGDGRAGGDDGGEDSDSDAVSVAGRRRPAGGASAGADRRSAMQLAHVRSPWEARQALISAKASALRGGGGGSGGGGGAAAAAAAASRPPATPARPLPSSITGVLTPGSIITTRKQARSGPRAEGGGGGGSGGGGGGGSGGGGGGGGGGGEVFAPPFRALSAASLVGRSPGLLSAKDDAHMEAVTAAWRAQYLAGNATAARGPRTSSRRPGDSRPLSDDQAARYLSRWAGLEAVGVAPPAWAEDDARRPWLPAPACDSYDNYIPRHVVPSLRVINEHSYVDGFSVKKAWVAAGVCGGSALGSGAGGGGSSGGGSGGGGAKRAGGHGASSRGRGRGGSSGIRRRRDGADGPHHPMPEDFLFTTLRAQPSIKDDFVYEKLTRAPRASPSRTTPLHAALPSSPPLALSAAGALPLSGVVRKRASDSSNGIGGGGASSDGGGGGSGSGSSGGILRKLFGWLGGGRRPSHEDGDGGSDDDGLPPHAKRHRAASTSPSPSAAAGGLPAPTRAIRYTTATAAARPRSHHRHH